MAEAAKEVWAILLGVPLGNVIGVIIVGSAIITGACVGMKRLYKAFEKYTLIKNENEKQKERISANESLFEELRTGMINLQKSFADLEEVNFKQLKFTIIRTCEEAIRDGCISTGRLAFLEEMYKEYVEIFNGNGYAKTMVDKVRELPIIGSSET